MRNVSVGERVRIDIPDETDPDHRRYHGKHGEVIAVIPDDAGSVTSDQSDADLYRIDLDTGGTFDARQRDLRPPID